MVDKKNEEPNNNWVELVADNQQKFYYNIQVIIVNLSLVKRS
jgi:hypothetical protein